MSRASECKTSKPTDNPTPFENAYNRSSRAASAGFFAHRACQSSPQRDPDDPCGGGNYTGWTLDQIRELYAVLYKEELR